MSNTKTASLEDTKAMKARGDVHHDPNAAEGPGDDYPGLPDEFWQRAEIVTPENRELVSTRVVPEVKAYFQKRHGKGYTRRMAGGLASYVRSHSPS